MELRQYWAILRRWFWLPILLGVLAGGLSIALAPKAQTIYSATLRAFISVPQETRSPEKYGFEGYYGWVASEYLVDDLSELVKTQAFADDVARQIGDPSIAGAAISGQQSTKRTHRILAITVTGGDANQVEKISKGIAAALDRNASQYVKQLGAGQASITVVDEPFVTAQVVGLRGNLDIVVRAALGVAAGIALALLLHYLDVTIHSASEAASTLGLPVLGEIPGERRRIGRRATA